MTESQREPHRIKRKPETRKAPGPLSKGSEGDAFDLGGAGDDIKEIKADLKAALDDLAFLKEKVEALPTTLQLIAFAIVVFAAANVFWLVHAVVAP